MPTRYIYMPTEFLHGLYDGGAGAGLEDYWRLMTASKPALAAASSGCSADEAMRRPDTGEMDVAGNQAPDGIVGPYREREGSFYTIKELWSPIQVRREPGGTFTVENHYSFTAASQCKFTWQLRRHPWPGEGRQTNAVLAQAAIAAPPIPPGGEATLPIELPAVWQEADVLALRVDDPGGRELWTWTWPMPRLEARHKLVNAGSRQAHFAGEIGDTIRLKCESLTIGISKQTGLLASVDRNGANFSLRRGPRLSAGDATPRSIGTNTIGGDVLVTATFDGDLRQIAWRLRGDGWLQCDFRYAASGPQDFLGVQFDYPEKLVKRKRWLGDGPFRVWKNRLRGVTLGLWENDYNDTITGHRGWVYPEFKGCFSGVRWMQLETDEGLVTFVPGGGIPYVQVLSPDQPPDHLVANTKFKLPQCGLGFLHGIPPIGTKFKPADQGGPQGRPNMGGGEHSGSVSFYFGALR